MGFWKDVGRGFSSHVDAIPFIFKNGLWVYFIYPFLIAILLFIVGFASYFVIKDLVVDWFMDFAGLNDGGIDDLLGGWLKPFIKLIVGLVVKLVLFFVFNSMYKYIVLIMLSPILALLSERVEEIKYGVKYPFEFKQFAKDVLRGILITLRNMFIEYGILLLCLIVIWVPVVGWIISIGLYILSAYFVGFSMMDYTSERRRFKISQSVRFVRRRKGIAISNGLIFNILLLIPFVGISIGPIVSVVAATLAATEAIDEDLTTGVKI